MRHPRPPTLPSHPCLSDAVRQKTVHYSGIAIVKASTVVALLAVFLSMATGCGEREQRQSGAVPADPRADNSGDTITLLPRWKVGENVRFEIAKAAQESRNGRITFRTGNRTNVEVEVLEADESGYAVAWTSGETKFDDPQQVNNPFAQRMLRLLKGTRIVLELDGSGSLRGLRNWQEIRAECMKGVDVILQEVGRSDLDKALIPKLRAQAESMLATREQIEALSTVEPSLCFAVLGKSYSRSKPLIYEGVMPNPFGGEAIPCKTEFVLKSVDKKLGRAVVAWKHTIVPEEFRRAMENMVRNMVGRLGKPVPQGELFKVVTIQNEAECSVDTSSGWLHSFRETRVLETDSVSRRESTTITRIAE